MTLEFEDLNDCTNYFSRRLLASKGIKSTNPVNSERYKNELGGEVIQQFFTIKDPTAVIGTYKNHKPHMWWAYSEILSEFLNLDPPLAYKYRPDLFSQHYDLLPDGRMQYTYSNRFVEFNQFVNIFKKLKENPNSKRAVSAIYTPYDTAPDRADSPCTIGQMFIQRDGKLNMTFSMRSWDLFGGFKTYDFAFESFTQQAFCSWLGFQPGNLGVYVNSLHYYNRDRENLEKLVEEVTASPLRSDRLILDGNLGIEDFYKQLRLVKASEEASFNQNIPLAKQIQSTLRSRLFKDMCEKFIGKNLKGIAKQDGNDR